MAIAKSVGVRSGLVLLAVCHYLASPAFATKEQRPPVDLETAQGSWEAVDTEHLMVFRLTVAGNKALFVLGLYRQGLIVFTGTAQVEKGRVSMKLKGPEVEIKLTGGGVASSEGGILRLRLTGMGN